MKKYEKKASGKIKEKLEELIEIPSGVNASLNSGLTVSGQKGTVKRSFKMHNIKITIDGNKIKLSAEKSSKNEKKILYALLGHIKNMIKGVQEGYVYKLQVCSVHFPITVAIDKASNTLVIKNFIGEAQPRKAKLLPNTDVKVEEDIITVESPDIEAAGQTAANIEMATRVKNKDRRVFQDGIWIISKAGEEMAE